MTVLNSKQIIDLITTPVGPVKVTSLLAAHRRRLASAGLGGRHELTPEEQLKYIQALSEHLQSFAPVQYLHPAEGHVPYTTGETLTQADTVWLGRLSDDPERVSWDDAAQLAAFARSVKARTSDRRLLDAVYRPVKAFHDLRLAEAQLQNAERAVTAGAPSPVAALAEAIGAETPELTRIEAASRADAIVRKVYAEVEASRDRNIAAAQERLAAVKAEVAALGSSSRLRLEGEAVSR